jgi:hypothetical protein
VRRIVALCSLQSVLFLAGIAVMLVLGNIRTTAQDIVDVECFDVEFGCDVEGTAAILESTDDVEIDTYASEEIISFDLLDQGFEADVVGSLFQDSSDNLIDSNEGFDDGSGFAETDMADPVELGSTYVVESDSYLDDVETGEQFFVGSAFAGVVAAAPEIDSLTPPSASSGTSGTLTVNGFALYDQFDGTVQVSPIPGLTWGNSFTGSADGTQIQLTYTIASNAVSGDQSFFLATRFGESNTVIFTIDDPPPVINSITPGTWQAGTDTSITVTGHGFGPCPTLSISGPGVSGFTKTGIPSDTQVQGTVTVDANSQGGQATVTVTSDGETCSGFHGPPGTTGNANNHATITPIPPTPPQILLDGQNVAGTTQNVVVGQKIALTVSISIPAGLTISSESWSGPDPAGTTGGFGNGSGGAPDATGGAELPMPSQICPANNPSCPFTYYYVKNENADQVGLSYTLSNGQQASSQVSFNVAGLSGNLILTANMPTGGSGVRVYITNGGDPVLGILGAPVTGGTVGISFTSNATPPSGYNQSFTWVQVISSDQNQFLGVNGAFSQPPAPQSGVDHAYPYANKTPTTTIDSPRTNLLDRFGETWRTFTARMYLMWDPGLPSGCTPASTDPVSLVPTPSTCTSIPVPLSSVQWHWSGCAINTLSPQTNGTTWVLSTTNGCPVQTLDAPKADSFPIWTSVVNP